MDKAAAVTVKCADCGSDTAVVRVPSGDVKALLRDALPFEYRGVLAFIPAGIDALAVIDAVIANRVHCIRCSTSQGV